MNGREATLKCSTHASKQVRYHPSALPLPLPFRLPPDNGNYGWNAGDTLALFHIFTVLSPVLRDCASWDFKVSWLIGFGSYFSDGGRERLIEPFAEPRRQARG